MCSTSNDPVMAIIVVALVTIVYSGALAALCYLGRRW